MEEQTKLIVAKLYQKRNWKGWNDDLTSADLCNNTSSEVKTAFRRLTSKGLHNTHFNVHNETLVLIHSIHLPQEILVCRCFQLTCAGTLYFCSFSFVEGFLECLFRGLLCRWAKLLWSCFLCSPSHVHQQYDFESVRRKDIPLWSSSLSVLYRTCCTVYWG